MKAYIKKEIKVVLNHILDNGFITPTILISKVCTNLKYDNAINLLVNMRRRQLIRQHRLFASDSKHNRDKRSKMLYTITRKGIRFMEDI